MSPEWPLLQIEPTTDVAAIKRAYAARLKEIGRERDIGAFQGLRAAYDLAIALARGEIVELDAEAEPAGIDRTDANVSDLHASTFAPDAPGEMPDTRSDTEAMARLLIDMARDPEVDAGALRDEIARSAVLDAFASRQAVSEQLFEALYPEPIAVRKLEALADAFHWMDGGAGPRREIYDWIRGLQLIDELEHDAAVPARARWAWRTLRRHLGNGHDWKRAFSWAVVPTAEYRLELAYLWLGTYLDGEVDLVLAEHEKQFMAELVAKRWTSPIGWSTLLARAVCLATVILMLAWRSDATSAAEIGAWLLWWPKGFVIATTLILSWRGVSSIIERCRGHGNTIAYVGFALMFLFVFLPELIRLYGPGS